VYAANDVVTPSSSGTGLELLEISPGSPVRGECCKPCAAMYSRLGFHGSSWSPQSHCKNTPQALMRICLHRLLNPFRRFQVKERVQQPCMLQQLMLHHPVWGLASKLRASPVEEGVQNPVRRYSRLGFHGHSWYPQSHCKNTPQTLMRVCLHRLLNPFRRVQVKERV
jgi:uncharacterized protein YggT (Ycf19 family)